MHYLKCEQCQELFKEKEQLIRHNFSEELIKTIENDSFEELKVEHFRKDEACVGVYSSTLDQDIPIVHLHSEECWNGWGSFLPHLARGPQGGQEDGDQHVGLQSLSPHGADSSNDGVMME